MRIKIATSHPLPSYKCWFAITEKLEKQTIHHLKRKLVRSLQLSQEPVQINLTIDDYNLLPQSKILDLVRDGDLVTIKREHVKPATTSKKRKLVEEKEEKRAKKKKTDDVKSGKKASEDTKLNRSTDSKKEKKSSDRKNKKASADKKKAKEVKEKKPVEEKETRVDKQKEEEPKVIKNKSLPFEGSKSTKARNLRRRLLKKHLREKQKNDTQPITNNVDSVALENTESAPPEYVEPEYIEAAYVEPEYIEPEYTETAYLEPTYTEQAYTEPPLVDNAEELLNTCTKLIKKNKNKKKNHLKGSKAKNRSHQHFDKENEPPATKNLYGRAFITVAESEANPRTYQSTYEYPIHKMPTLFYAENPIIDEPVQENERLDVSEPVEDSMSMDGNVSEEDAPEELPNNKSDMDKPADYEKYPDADFVNNIPTVGNQLAIKTLELTANYTPEISEWKQVVLLELNLPESVTIEYKKGFGKASTKGGKFDNKKHQKRYYEEYEQEGELNEEEEEEEEERVVTLATTDIFAVKNMS